MAPVLLLLAIGFLFWRREQIAAQKFRPVVESIGLTKLPPTPDGKLAVSFTVHVDHRSTKPGWWGQPIEAGLGEMVYRAHRLPAGWKRPTAWTVRGRDPACRYDAQRRQYVVAFYREGGGTKMYDFPGVIEGELFFEVEPGSNKAAVRGMSEQPGPEDGAVSAAFKRAFDFRS